MIVFRFGVCGTGCITFGHLIPGLNWVDWAKVHETNRRALSLEGVGGLGGFGDDLVHKHGV